MNKTCEKCGKKIDGTKLWLEKYCGECYVEYLRTIPSADHKKVARRLKLQPRKRDIRPYIRRNEKEDGE